MAEKTTSTFANILDVKTRDRQHKERMVDYVGDLILPVTEGFDQVNQDMTFSYLGNYELQRVENLSAAINICHIYQLKQSVYLLRGELATLLNSRKSRNAKSMELFTNVTASQKQEYQDKTEQKQGFKWFGFGKKQGG